MALSPGNKNNVTTIGMFDSGVGGLSVLRKLERLNEHSDNKLKFLYVGDTARCPYGNRDQEEIILFAKQIVDWLIASGADRIVIACNTSAAMAGATVKLRAAVPVYDLINPTAEYLARRPGKVAVLATQSTVRTRAFSKAIGRLNNACEVVEIACPDLVPLVESGQMSSIAARNALWSYVKDFQASKVTSVVLGCTHYPFLCESLAHLLPPDIQLVDPAEQLLQAWTNAAPLVKPDEAAAGKHGQNAVAFHVTGSASAFASTASLCLGREIANVQTLPIEVLTGLSAEPVVTAEPVSPAVSPAT